MTPFRNAPSSPAIAIALPPCGWVHRAAASVRDLQGRGPAAIDAAEVLAVDTDRIATAISYHGDYASEIDVEVADADEASARAEAAWRVQQQLIA